MKKFKKGDRVLVRNNDLEEWRAVIYNKIDKSYTRPFLDMNGHVWSQCRHIDDFRTGDEVQVYIKETDKWFDAVYACYIPNAKTYKHCAFSDSMSHLTVWEKCRWHPSMPWAEKEEPLTLEQRVEALERKMNER